MQKNDGPGIVNEATRGRGGPAVVLLSGGMDSATLIHYVTKRLAVREIYALTFIYGQRHVRETEMARWQAESAGAAGHRIIDISFLAGLIAGSSALTDEAVRIPDLAELDEYERRQPPTYVPSRNMIFLSIGAAWAEALEAQDIFYGAHAGDEYGYWDCTPGFVSSVNSVLALNRRNRVTVRAPFVDMSKIDVVKIGLELGVDYAHTWSCYRGQEKHCGACPSCEARKTALLAAGVEETEIT